MLLRRHRVGPSTAVVLALALAAGCTDNTTHVPCMNVTGPSALVSQAGALRIDVYDGEAQCDGQSVAGGVTPSTSNLFTPEQAISLQVPPGHHAVVLTTYADAAATTPIGRGCVVADLSAGADVCLELAVSPVVLDSGADGGGGDGGCGASCPCTSSPDNCGVGTYCDVDNQCAPGCKSDGDCSGTAPHCDVARHACVACLATSDCTAPLVCSGGNCVPVCDPSKGVNCPAGSTCCSGVCVDLASDVQNCGGCGRACAVTRTVNLACAGGVCTSSCATGYGNCTQPTAPTADDGCETNTASDANHCGSCSNKCSEANASAVCMSSSCAVGMCSASFQDCDSSAANGCECAGNACCGTGCQIKHNNGSGEFFYDCTPTGTYNEQQALEACAAYTGNMSQCHALTCTSGKATGELSVCSDGSPTDCICWAYQGGGMELQAGGHVYNSGAPGFNNCGCVFNTDPVWN